MKVLFWNEIVVVVLFLIAILVSLAIHNDKNIKESPIKMASRRLIIGAKVMVIIRICWFAYESDGTSSSLSLSYSLIFMVWGLGSIMSNVDLFSRGWGREISELLHPKIHYERRKSPRRAP